ncbi:MAG: hypothetical protein AB7I30_17920 [Isosphaeraceae bacterium]
MVPDPTGPSDPHAPTVLVETRESWPRLGVVAGILSRSAPTVKPNRQVHRDRPKPLRDQARTKAPESDSATSHLREPRTLRENVSHHES